MSFLNRALQLVLVAVVGLGATRAQAQSVVLPPPWVSPDAPPVFAPEAPPVFAPGAPGWRDTGPDDFPLDAIPREVGSGTLRCPEIDLVHYSGDIVGYRGAARVNAPFRERLRRFEQIVHDTATEVYGRAPTRMRLMGTYSCRRIRRIDGLISEHAFGNAIDVAAFDFPRAPAGPSAATGDPRLSRAFSVSVARHWTVRGTDSLAAVHSRFLRTLISRLIAEPRLFRVLIGPADPDHWNHFHLDCAPYHFVNV